MSDYQLRQAEMDDASVIYQWRNDLRVRRMFFDTKEISYQNHCKWLEGVIADDQRTLLLGLENKTPFGVIRFDKIGSTYEIDIFVDPDRSGEGLGKTLLALGVAWAQEHFESGAELVAKVLPENEASCRLFQVNGFDFSYVCFSKKL